jgi:hypothetical protein
MLVPLRQCDSHYSLPEPPLLWFMTLQIVTMNQIRCLLRYNNKLWNEFLISSSSWKVTLFGHIYSCQL